MSEQRALEALQAVGAALPTGDRCHNWTPCMRLPVVRVGEAELCADHAPRLPPVQVIGHSPAHPERKD